MDDPVASASGVGRAAPRLLAALLAGTGLALGTRLAVLEGLWSLERERPLVLRWVESLSEHPKRTCLGCALIVLAALGPWRAHPVPPEPAAQAPGRHPPS